MNSISFPFRLTSTATVNSIVIKSSQGQLCNIIAVNTSGSLRYLKLYNKAANPAPASDSGILVAVIPIPASTNGAGFTMALPSPLYFEHGIAMAITANPGDTDATAIGANECFVTLFWK